MTEEIFSNLFGYATRAALMSSGLLKKDFSRKDLSNS